MSPYNHTEFQVTLRFTDLSCNRLLVVTTDYTLVLYLWERVVLMGMGGNHPPYICYMF
jgi:hypothetical protein